MSANQTRTPAPAAIVPVRPATSTAPAAAVTISLLRRTFGKYNPSRRTFGVFHPSRRTFGRGNASRRTFGVYHPSRRTFGRGNPSRRTFGSPPPVPADVWDLPPVGKAKRPQRNAWRGRAVPAPPAS